MAWTLFAAAVLLSVERTSYVWIWRHPHRFQAVCAHPIVAALGEPVDVLRCVFYGFKGLQLAVFAGWCFVYGEGSIWPPDGGPVPIALGGVLIATGQLLNVGVFYRLGSAGVFYGNRFGYSLPWCDAFPFSVLDHPQYVGAVLSIWGVFLIMRFPHDDWMVLPVLETAYYYLGARFEQ